MKVSQATIQDGQLVETNVKEIQQSNLSAECWYIQMFGASICQKCQYKGGKQCGGKKIRKTGKNEKGIKIPV